MDTEINSEFWHDGEPNNWQGQKECCAQYAPGYWFGDRGTGYLINDRACNIRYCYVCQS